MCEQIYYPASGLDAANRAAYYEKSAALEEVFYGLEIASPVVANAIPYEALIPAIVSHLIRMAPACPEKRAVPDHRALIDFTKQCGKTLASMDQLPAATLYAMSRMSLHVEALRMGLNISLILADCPEVRGRRGRRRKGQVRRFARQAAIHYYRLTGKEPSRATKNGEPAGPFLEFLQTIFRILGIKDSPLTQAIEISRDWNQIVQNPAI